LAVTVNTHDFNNDGNSDIALAQRVTATWRFG